MVARLRRIRPAPTLRIRRAPRVLDGVREVVVTVEVRARVSGGSVSEEEFLAWVKEGVERYHLWRNGWVGLGCTGQVVKPEVRDGSQGRED